ncbi:RNA N(6)-adenosine-methyltransferase mettl16 [Oratosquilla oratoria]|uniref:RNA N(6)-adenosine-methyltransferase mettl16 n=1 Tax=Oratosquilla oratoria TaxID=337810 RepID=UPI003F76C7C1
MSKGPKKVSSLNKFMHPRNPYRQQPSFKELATKYPEFRAHCTYGLNGKVYLDFKNPKAVSALTISLLDKDFGLKVEIAEGHLVPTLPLRFNYLFWVEDLLQQAAGVTDSVVGLDIGTGSCCVYPLLAAKKLGWRMVASETDHENYTYATKNVKNNDLQHFIHVQEVPQDVVVAGVLQIPEVQKFVDNCRSEASQTEGSSESTVSGAVDVQNISTSSPAKSHPKYLYDFVMCNPPFFGSEEELDSVKKSRKSRREPSSAPTGTVNERVTSGSEVQFVSTMIRESVDLRHKVRIFTSLLGTKAHVKPVRQVLNEVKPAHHTVTEFCQGRTMRWAIAWTFDAGCRVEGVVSKKAKLNQKPLTIHIPRTVSIDNSINGVWNIIEQLMQELKVKVRILKKNGYFVGVSLLAWKATWVHQRRARRAKMRLAESKDNDAVTEEKNKSDKVQEISEEQNKRKIEHINEINNGNLNKRMKNSGPDHLEMLGEEIINTSHDDDDEQRTPHSPTCHNRAEDQGGLELEHMSTASSGDDTKEGDHITVAQGSSVGEKRNERPITAVQAEANSSEMDVQEKSSEFEEKDPGTCAADEAKINPERKAQQAGVALGKECALRCNLYIKQVSGVTTVELKLVGGYLGRDGLNQLMQVLRNHLIVYNTAS